MQTQWMPGDNADDGLVLCDFMRERYPEVEIDPDSCVVVARHAKSNRQVILVGSECLLPVCYSLTILSR